MYTDPCTCRAFSRGTISLSLPRPRATPQPLRTPSMFFTHRVSEGGIGLGPCRCTSKYTELFVTGNSPHRTQTHLRVWKKVPPKTSSVALRTGHPLHLSVGKPGQGLAEELVPLAGRSRILSSTTPAVETGGRFARHLRLSGEPLNEKITLCDCCEVHETSTI